MSPYLSVIHCVICRHHQSHCNICTRPEITSTPSTLYVCFPRLPRRLRAPSQRT